jgi:hypothetical protein
MITWNGAKKANAGLIDPFEGFYQAYDWMERLSSTGFVRSYKTLSQQMNHSDGL